MTDTVENKHTLDVEQIMALLPHRYPFFNDRPSCRLFNYRRAQDLKSY